MHKTATPKLAGPTWRVLKDPTRTACDDNVAVAELQLSSAVSPRAWRRKS